jgi:hypothetical protein
MQTAIEASSFQPVRHCIDCGTAIRPSSTRCRVHAAAQARKVLAEPGLKKTLETND